MSKARSGARPRLGDKVATAKVRYAKVGPRKVRAVVDIIRGLDVASAEAQLAAIHRPSSVPMLKRLLKSAVSNANQGDARHEPKDLIVGRIHVDSGPATVRFRPRAMGRATPINRRTAHVTVELYTRPV